MKSDFDFKFKEEEEEEEEEEDEVEEQEEEERRTHRRMKSLLLSFIKGALRSNLIKLALFFQT